MGNKSKIQDPKSKTKIFWSLGFRIWNLFWILSLGFWILLSACSTSFDSHGIYHRVRKGENLIWVAASYGVELQDVAELNNIEDTEKPLEPGQKLYIPPKRFYRHKKLPFEGELSKHIERPRKRSKEKLLAMKAKNRVYTEHSHFLWPVAGSLMSPFGVRHGRRHDGIDIRASRGTPIKAADSGRVVYVGHMRGYGNLILIRHPDNLFTAYAHNQINLAKERQNVKRGETIAKVGRTGRATGPHLHFEVREGEKARNPLFFLPVIR